MAYTTKATSVQAKTNINGEIATSVFNNTSEGSVIRNISLTEIQNAINKLSTYINKVDNCGNCYNITMCQTTGTKTKTVTKYVYYNTYYNTYYDTYYDNSEGGGD